MFVNKDTANIIKNYTYEDNKKPNKRPIKEL